MALMLRIVIDKAPQSRIFRGSARNRLRKVVARYPGSGTEWRNWSTQPLEVAVFSGKPF